MDIQQIEQLVDLHGTAIYRFCYRLTGVRADAEDLYQETFLRVLKTRERINPDQNVRGYLFSAAVHVYRSARRKLARRQRIAPRASEEEALDIPDAYSLEQDFITQEACLAVRQMVASLDDRLRIPLYLHYTAEMSIEEIASTLSLPPGTVKSRMYKARTIIRKKMEENAYGYKPCDGTSA